MWFVKAVLFIVLLGGLLYVALLNDQNDPINLYFTKPNIPTIPNVRISIVLVGSVVAGMLLGFMASFIQVLSAKSEVTGLRRRNRELARELTDLRNMPVKDLDPNTLPPLLSDEDASER